MNVYNKETIDSLLLEKLGLDKEDMDKFNFAQITKTIDSIEHIEYWIMSNAYYDDSAERFVKMNLHNASFGIQIQASGVYPGEHALGYNDIMGINIWRCPAWLDDNDDWIVYMDSTTYDYTDVTDANKHYMGAKRRSNNEWVEYAITTGWNNNLMTDSFGGVTIGGAGFEVDGNGIFPYTRLTSSVGYINGSKYYMLGLLDNAYHGSTSNWDCDDNKHYSWFCGLISPPLMNGSSEVYLTKDLSNAKFVVMYNDTPENTSDIHDMNTNKWHIIVEANATSIKGMVSGTLTTLGAGGGGGASITQEITDGDTTHAPSGDAVYDALALKANTSAIGNMEVTTNKSASITTDTGDTTKYPTVKAVEDYIDSVIGDANDWLTN